MRNQPQGWALGPAGLSWAQSVSSPSSSAVMSGPTSEQFLGGDFSRGTFRLSRQPWSCGWGQGSSLQVGGELPGVQNSSPQHTIRPSQSPSCSSSQSPSLGCGRWPEKGLGEAGSRHPSATVWGGHERARSWAELASPICPRGRQGVF